MRLKPTDMSFTVSEMPHPRDTEQNISVVDFQGHDPDLIDDSSFKRDSRKSSSSHHGSHHSPHSQCSSRKSSAKSSEVKYEVKPFKRPKSSLGPGRLNFKGRLQYLDEFADRESSEKKGKKMSKINYLMKESQEKTREKREVVTIKKQQELSELKIRIAEMKKQNEEIKKKMKIDTEIKQKKAIEQNKQQQHQIRVKLEIKAKRDIEEKKVIIQKVKKEKEEIIEKRKSQEREFIEHIQYQYHIDRKAKREEMKKYEEQIKQLEQQEELLISQLHKTIAWEQQQALDFRKSVDAHTQSMRTFQSTSMSQSKKSKHDILDIYQTPRTTRQLMNQEPIISSNDHISADKLQKSRSNKTLKPIREGNLNKTPQPKTKIKNEYKTTDNNNKQYLNMTPDASQHQILDKSHDKDINGQSQQKDKVKKEKKTKEQQKLEISHKQRLQQEIKQIIKVEEEKASEQKKGAMSKQIANYKYEETKKHHEKSKQGHAVLPQSQQIKHDSNKSKEKKEENLQNKTFEVEKKDHQKLNLLNLQPIREQSALKKSQTNRKLKTQRDKSELVGGNKTRNNGINKSFTGLSSASQSSSYHTSNVDTQYVSKGGTRIVQKIENDKQASSTQKLPRNFSFSQRSNGSHNHQNEVNKSVQIVHKDEKLVSKIEKGTHQKLTNSQKNTQGKNIIKDSPQKHQQLQQSEYINIQQSQQKMEHQHLIGNNHNNNQQNKTRDNIQKIR